MNEVLDVTPLGFPWQTRDPFLFCVHHLDAYPRGNAALGPAVSLAGRNLGQDFAGKDGFSMYHGEVVPGFPQHPHRGFETVTIARRGFIDHSDSLGATARFGQGDVQWMTAGRGIVHSEMFPLLREDEPNPLELFQIWLNLPRAEKMAEPHFTMLWSHTLPKHISLDSRGRRTEVTVIAGALDGRPPPSPPPRSWAARPSSNVAIWTITMAAGAEWQLPPALLGNHRTLYLFRGDTLSVAGQVVRPRVGISLRADAVVSLQCGDADCELLLLQGQPIGEPSVSHGPFVMSTVAEIQLAISDYRRTQFGGWPWPSDAPVHARERGRFAIHVNGRHEVPE